MSIMLRVKIREDFDLNLFRPMWVSKLIKNQIPNFAWAQCGQGPKCFTPILAKSPIPPTRAKKLVMPSKIKCFFSGLEDWHAQERDAIQRKIQVRCKTL